MSALFSRNSHKHLLIFLIIIGLAGERACADDLSIIPYVPNILSINYNIDSNDGRDVFLYTNLGLKPRHRLSLGLGEQNETVSESEEGLNSNTYLAGYSYYSDKGLQFGAEYENWGEKDKITTDTLSVFASFKIDMVSVAISPQFRNITVYTNSQCSGEIDSNALKINLDLYPSESWSVSAAYTSFDYSKNRSRLLSCVDPGELSLVIARLQLVAYDNQRTLGFEYYQDTETYGFQWSQSESAIDAAIVHGINAYMSTDALEDWSITVTIGIQENYDDSTTQSLQGTLTYYW